MFTQSPFYRLAKFTLLVALLAQALGPVASAWAASPATPPEAGFCQANPSLCVAEGLTTLPVHRPAALTQTAHWGKGSILAVATTPDGQSYIVGSATGLAVYDAEQTKKAPRWQVLEEPFWYYKMEVSSDNNYVRFTGRERAQRVYSLEDGTLISNLASIVWPRTVNTDGWNTMAIAPDNSRKFTSYVTDMDEDGYYMGEEKAIREVYDFRTRKLLYTLTDTLLTMTPDEYVEPAGCEISFFSFCGNAYSAVIYSPSEAVFAPDSQTFAVLYRIPSGGYHVRTYNAADGKLLNMIGGIKQPVRDFAYTPDARSLWVGFENGAVQLWDIERNTFTFSAWHFSSPIYQMSYTPDGKYIFIQREGLVEVRRQSDGALWKRYVASDYALSPLGQTAVLANDEGQLTFIEIATGQITRQIQAHKKRIFALAFSPDGRWLATSSEDCTIRLWDAATGEFLHLFEQTIVNAYEEPGLESRIFIRALHFIPNTNQLLGFGSWGVGVSWNVNSGATQFVITSPPLEYYNGMMTLDPHFPSSYAVEVENNRLFIGETAYNLTTGELVKAAPPKTEALENCEPTNIRTPDGAWRFGYGSQHREGQICIIATATASVIDAITVLPRTSDVGIRGFTTSPDGQQLLVALTNSALVTYDVNH